MRDIEGWSLTGRPLDFIEAAILGADHGYRYVAQTDLFKDGLEVCVSTMFIVETISEDPERENLRPPCQFETMLFANGTFLRGADLAGDDPVRDMIDAIMGGIFGYKKHWPTFEAAVRGHVRHVDKLRADGFRASLGSSVTP